MSALGECVGKVLSLSPAVPLQTRRLLLSLWQQTEAVGLDALERCESDAGARLAREAAAAERRRLSTRKLLEAQIVAVAECEDTITELHELVELQKKKTQMLRRASRPS